MIKNIKRFLHYLNISIRKPEMEVLPGNLAFFFMMMIIPLLTIITTVIANLNLSDTMSLNEAVFKHFPSNIANLIHSIESQGSSSVSVWAILIGSLLLASNGTYSIIVTANSTYGIKKSSFIKNKIKSIILVIVLVILFTMLLIVPIVNSQVLDFIAKLTKTNMATNIYFLLYKILKYPVLFLFVYIFVKILYRFSPSGGRRKTSYGAVFTSILLIISTWGYSIYIEYFSDFQTIYGGISNLLFLMLWINLIAYVFVLGMNLNAAREKVHDEIEKENKEKEALETPLIEK